MASNEADKKNTIPTLCNLPTTATKEETYKIPMLKKTNKTE